MPAQVDFRFALGVRAVGFDEHDIRKLGRDRRPHAFEHAEVARSFALEFVALPGVVHDRRSALESLRAETVLGMEVGDG